MAKQYETTMINEGGRNGFVYDPEKSTKYVIKAPAQIKLVRAPTRNNFLLPATVHVLTVPWNSF